MDTKNKKPNFKNRKPAPIIHVDHRPPQSRRDFLANGAIAISATAILPSFATLVSMSNTAYAQSGLACPIPQFLQGLPYICIDVAGGMNIAGANAIVGISNGGEFQEDVGTNVQDYIRLGISPEEHPSLSGKVDERFGLKFHRASGILQGMREVLDGVVINNKPIENSIDGLVFCTRTADDSQNNQINTVYMANKAGAKGELVELVGNANTNSGGRSDAPTDQMNLSIKPMLIRSHEDTVNLLSLGNSFMGSNYLNSFAQGGEERVQKFMDRIARMNRSRVDDIASRNSIEQIQKVLNCSFETAKTLFSKFSSDALNSANDQDVINVFDNDDERVASVAKLVLDGLAGAGTITIGGGDYHGGTIVNTHNKDVEVGKTIGLCIRLAAAKQKNLVIHLFTDGGVSGDSGGVTEEISIPGIGSSVGKVKWVGDSGTRSSALMIVYKHNSDGSSLVRESNGTGRRQVGNFVPGGGVNLNTVVGNSTENLWKAIMLNYLAAQGKEGDFEEIFGRGSLPPDYESLIRLKPIV